MTSSIISESERKRIAYNKYKRGWRRTKAGLIANIYGNQRLSSRQRNHPMPDYDLEELRAWAYKHQNFENIYQAWVSSGFEKTKIPSCDRIDDYKPYTLDNLQIVTWAENNDRYREDKKAGINRKGYKAILQMTNEGKIITEHYSAMQASRVTGIDNSHISKCCRGKLRSAGGFVWVFSGDQ